MRTQRALLLIVRHLLPVIVQPDLADGHHFRMLCQHPQLRQGRIVEIAAIVRMHADGRVDVRIPICQGQHPAARRQVDGRIDDDLDPGGPCALDDGLAIAVELAQVEMAVGVDDGRRTKD